MRLGNALCMRTEAFGPLDQASVAVLQEWNAKFLARPRVLALHFSERVSLHEADFPSHPPRQTPGV